MMLARRISIPFEAGIEALPCHKTAALGRLGRSWTSSTLKESVDTLKVLGMRFVSRREQRELAVVLAKPVSLSPKAARLATSQVHSSDPVGIAGTFDGTLLARRAARNTTCAPC
jgi:hypothetical protein